MKVWALRDTDADGFESCFVLRFNWVGTRRRRAHSLCTVIYVLRKIGKSIWLNIYSILKISFSWPSCSLVLICMRQKCQKEPKGFKRCSQKMKGVRSGYKSKGWVYVFIREYLYHIQKWIWNVWIEISVFFFLFTFNILTFTVWSFSLCYNELYMKYCTLITE